MPGLIIGYLPGDSNNSVNVVESNSVLSIQGNTPPLSSVIVGRSGSQNSLTIANGGAVISPSAYIGEDRSSSSNTVLVSGTGSLWSNNGTIDVGYSGSENSLVISNGATVDGASLVIIIGFYAYNNSVLVAGTGSTLNASYLSLANGSSNSLTISNGGGVISQTAVISFDGPSLGLNNYASNNSVLVTGDSSVWTNSGTLIVGDGGSGIVTVSSGGTLASSSIELSNLSDYSAATGGNGTLTIGQRGTVTSSNIVIASQSNSIGTLNFGTPGLNDTNVSLTVSAISFGSGSGTMTFSQADTSDITCTISGYGTINQQGSGTTILIASNSFSGEVTVTSGKLQIASSGTLSGGGSTLVSQGGTLENEGALSGTTSIGGTLAGNGGSFTNLQFTGDSSLIWNINSFAGIAGTNWDELNASSLDLSALSATNPVTIHVQGISGSGSTNAPTYYTFNFLNVSNSVTEFDPGDFVIDSSLFTNALGISGGSWGVATNATNGGEQVSLIYTVPEPSSYVLILLGVFAVILSLCRRSA